jgi:hypothetical protein
MPNFSISFGAQKYNFIPSSSDGEISINLTKGDYQFLRPNAIELKFNSKTARIIYEQSLGTEFTVNVMDDYHRDFFVGTFYRRDCRFVNAESGDYECTVNIEVEDDYRKVLEGYNTAINITQKAKATTPTRFRLPSIVQVYVSNTNYVTNISDGASWTSPISESPSYLEVGDLPSSMVENIGDVKEFAYVNGVSLAASPVSGEYESVISSGYVGSGTPLEVWRNKVDNDIYIGSVSGSVTPEVMDFNHGSRSISFKVSSSDLDDLDFGSIWTLLGFEFFYFGRSVVNGVNLLHFMPSKTYQNSGTNLPLSGTLVHSLGAVNTADISYFSRVYTNDPTQNYSRLIVVDNTPSRNVLYIQDEPVVVSDATGIQGIGRVLTQTDVKLINPSDPTDIVNFVHRRVVARVLHSTPIPGSNSVDTDDFAPITSYPAYSYLTDYDVKFSDLFLNEDVGYGVFSNEAEIYDGKYFDVYSDNTYAPILNQDWRSASMWFKTTAAISNIFNQITIRDGYALGDIINAILLEIGSDVRYGGSLFLSGASPLSDIRGEIRFTPVSNLLETNYTRAASVGDVTLKKLMDFLQTKFNLFWHIEDGLLKIEHLEYYQNGRSYRESSGLRTEMIDFPRVESSPKNYGFEESYDDGLPKRYVRKYRDDMREVFSSTDIIYEEAFLKEDANRESQVEFMPDIFFILTNKNDVNKASLAVYIDRNGYIPPKTFTHKKREVIVLNGDLSLMDVEPFRYQSHSDNMFFNGNVTSLSKKKIKLLKTSSLFPISLQNIHKVFNIEGEEAIIQEVLLNAYDRGNEVTFAVKE